MAVDRSWKYASNCGAARRDQLNAWTDFRHIAVFLNASIEAIGLKECRGHLPGCWCTKMISHSTDQRATWPLACGLRRPPKENAKPSGGCAHPKAPAWKLRERYSTHMVLRSSPVQKFLGDSNFIASAFHKADGRLTTCRDDVTFAYPVPPPTPPNPAPASALDTHRPQSHRLSAARTRAVAQRRSRVAAADRQALRPPAVPALRY